MALRKDLKNHVATSAFVFRQDLVGNPDAGDGGVRNDNCRVKLVKLIAQCGPLDMDKPEPAITVMMPDED